MTTTLIEPDAIVLEDGIAEGAAVERALRSGEPRAAPRGRVVGLRLSARPWLSVAGALRCATAKAGRQAPSITSCPSSGRSCACAQLRTLVGRRRRRRSAAQQRPQGDALRQSPRARARSAAAHLRSCAGLERAK